MSIMDDIDVIGVLFILVLSAVSIMFYGWLIWMLIQWDLQFEHVLNVAFGWFRIPIATFMTRLIVKQLEYASLATMNIFVVKVKMLALTAMSNEHKLN